MDVQVKRKVMGKVELGTPRQQSMRPVSPIKIVRSTASPTTTTPTPRPKAKVSSSATPSNLSRKVASSPVVQTSSSARSTVSYTSTPRSHSPTKQLDALRMKANGRLSPALSTASRLRAKTNATPIASSLPSTPRQAQTPSIASPEVLPPSNSDPAISSKRIRVRHASISSISQISPSPPLHSQLLSPPTSSLSSQHDSETPSSVSPLRIMAKVTGMAKSKAAPGTPTTPSALTPSPLSTHLPSPPSRSSSPNRQITRRIGRTSSVSSLSAQEPIYPITVAHPAANAHRFASARASASFSRSPLPFSSSSVSYGNGDGFVDPATIPLPPLSPPSSTVSFSSHSSVSRSSLSSKSHTSAPAFQLNINDANDAIFHGNGWNGVLLQPSRSRAGSIATQDTAYPNGQAEEDMDEERKLRAEAKSNRKIADLEITNTSLLTINGALEASKHKQAKEIRELRRKLRETRLVLPPKVYREMRDSHGSDSFYQDERDDDDDDDDEDGEGEDVMEGATEGTEMDMAFLRVRALVDSLLKSAREALESKPEDFEPSPRGGKVTRVLHEVEARSWRVRGARATDDYNHSLAQDMNGVHDTDDEVDSSAHSLADDDISFAGANNSSRSEEEVEFLIGAGLKDP